MPLDVNDFLSNFLADLAAKLTEFVVGEVSGSVRRKLLGDKEQQALQGAFTAALEAMMQSFPSLNEDQTSHYDTIFTDFLATPEVLEQLALFVEPRPDAQLDIATLERSFITTGYDTTTIEGIDFQEAMNAFSQAYLDAVGMNSQLADIVQVQTLRELLRSSRAKEGHVERVAETTDAISDDVRSSVQLLDQVVQGQERQTDLLRILTQIQQGGTPAELSDAIRLLATRLDEIGVPNFYQTIVNQDIRVDEVEIEADVRPGISAELVESLVAALRDMRQTIDVWAQESEPDDEALDELEAQYRRVLAEEFRQLEFRGILQARDPLVLPLANIFVNLRALPRRLETETPELARLRQRQEDLQERLKKEHAHSRRQELELELNDLRRQEDLLLAAMRAASTDDVSLADVWKDESHHRALIVLGDPGSGKTTLLKYISLAYAEGADAVQQRLATTYDERLPVFLPLAFYDAVLQTGANKSLQEYLSQYYDIEKSLPGMGPVFARAFEQGRVVLLLDGLDEVLEAKDRQRIATRVDAFLRAIPRGNRVVLSSRIVGYGEAALSGEWPHFTMVDWNTEERRSFLRQFLAAFEARKRGEDPNDPTAHTRQQAGDLCTKLMKAIEDGPISIQRLAGNPLLLTILTVVFAQEGLHLPQRRVELYARYVYILIETWKRVRTAGLKVGPPAEESRIIEERLAYLALHLQENYSSGTAPRAVLEYVLCKETGLSPNTACQFMDDVRKWSGLLVERGRDAFGFLHLTFQEYLAARALASMSHRERMRYLEPHLFDPRWREVMLLTAGRLNMQDDRAQKVPEFMAGLLHMQHPGIIARFLFPWPHWIRWLAWIITLVLLWTIPNYAEIARRLGEATHLYLAACLDQMWWYLVRALYIVALLAAHKWGRRALMQKYTLFTIFPVTLLGAVLVWSIMFDPVWQSAILFGWLLAWHSRWIILTSYPDLLILQRLNLVLS